MRSQQIEPWIRRRLPQVVLGVGKSARNRCHIDGSAGSLLDTIVSFGLVPGRNAVHANVALFRRMVEVWGSGDREGAAGFFAENVVFHYPGPGPLHGDHRGRDGIIRFWAEQDRLTGGGFRPEFLGLAADDHRVYLLVRFETADASISFHRAAVYDVEDGAFTAARFFEDDPEAAVAFFSLAGQAS